MSLLVPQNWCVFLKRAVAVIAVFSPLSGCVTHEASQYLGANPVIAFGSDLMVGQSTMQFDESKPGVDWGMSLVWQGDHYLLTADQNTTPGQPTQVWQVVAVQDIPLLRQGQMLAMGSCRKWGIHNSRVVALVDYQADKQWFDHFEGAWIYDYRSKDFESYPTEHLECLNPRYGLGLDKPVPTASTAPVAVSQAAPVHRGEPHA
jgi:hypothetical protein